MSIATEISRITALRNRIRTKLRALGISPTGDETLEECAEYLEDVTKRTSDDMTNSVSSSGGGICYPEGYYYVGLKTDSNLIASNVKSGVSIFGTSGTFTADADAVASNIDSGKTAYVNGSKVTGTSTKITPSGNKAITATTSTQTGIDVSAYATASVAPTPSETKTATPSTSAQDITPTSGKLLSKVTVSAMPSGSATTPATTKQQSQPSITVSSSGLITASVAATSVDVTPTVSAGYVSSGTKGTVTMSANSNTKQLTAKSAQTYTPTTTAQTIASGQYLTGVQTIEGDANLIADNIAEGVSIFGVEGTHSGGTPVYSGSFTPSSTLSEITLTTATKCSHVLIFTADNAEATLRATYSIVLYFYDSTKNYGSNAIVGARGSGTGSSSVMFTTSNRFATFNDNSVYLYDDRSGGGGGRFTSVNTYYWYAW